MSRADLSIRIDVQALAESGDARSGTVLLQKMERLAPDLIGLEPDSTVKWQVSAGFRASAQGGQSVWLHLTADAVLPLACQRCLNPVGVPVQLDQSYRFVESEEMALAEDDESDEDLLVMEPLLDLTALLEDELLLAVPIVPLHAVCPVAVVLQAGDADLAEPDVPRPNAFAALAGLKKPEKKAEE